MQKQDVVGSNGWNVGENEARLARARVAFDEGLREASEKGTRAARRMIVPVLWGGALIGGALLAMAIFRLTRRQPVGPALFRVHFQQPTQPASSLLPALGGALARLAIKHFLKPAPEPLPEHLTTDSLLGSDAARLQSPTGNGRAKP